MNKTIKNISFCFILLLSGCVYTAGLFDARKYEETVSSLYVTEDKKKLIIMTNDFHYIIDSSIELEEILNSEYKRYLDTSFHDFHINNENVVKGNIHIYIKPSDKQELSEKTIRNIETNLLKGNKLRKLFVEGKRYSASGLQPKTSLYQLNKTYKIKIKEDLSGGEKLLRIPLTPVTLVGDTLYIGMVVLVMLPIMSLAGGR